MWLEADITGMAFNAQVIEKRLVGGQGHPAKHCASVLARQ